jgi:biotin transport system substrate-specific component
MGQAGQPQVEFVSSAALTTLMRVAGTLGFIVFTWLGARVYVPLEPYGIPMTLQTLSVVLSALCLGPRYGVVAMAGYVLVGAIGAPVFSEGNSGVGVLIGQTGGYLVGFILSQPVITWFVRGPDGACRGWLGLILGVVVGNLVIFMIGVPWLYFVRVMVEPTTVWDSIHGGMVVFLPGMAVKSILAVLIGRVAAPWASRRIW